MAASEPSAAEDTSQPMPSPPHADAEMQLTLTHHGNPIEFTLAFDATIADLSTLIAEDLSIPPSNQKLMVTPKLGLLKPPFRDPSLPLSSLVNKKIVLMGSTAAEISSLDAAILTSQSRSSRRGGRPGDSASPVKATTPTRRRDWKKDQEEATYTFTTLRPLPYLPKPERSLRFLERLRDDAGIKASMRKHKWTVPLLTEMNPAEHTTRESRTLGLNRNGGEVIELRLRTDAYDGYRDYKVIRKTLCHEMAHNVWGEHDRNFWDLCKEIEIEVERGDWRSGGHALSEQEFYNPEDSGMDEDCADHGGWTGGEFVLGGSGSEPAVSNAGGVVGAGSLSRREILARAAEERMRKQRQLSPDGGGSTSES
ncbi:MAG: hypothetical protein M1827_002068 [Pycnora praestabilis]|nr:MAG: hypothetical protein M1827_002068 [Pycnora praestabilis]